MRIIIRVWGETAGMGEGYTGDCDFAVVEVTPQLIATIRNRVSLMEQVKKADGMLCEGSFFDYSASYYPWAIHEELEAILGGDIDGLDDDGWTVIPEAYGLTIEPQRTEIDCMIVSPAIGPNGSPFINWTAQPKHSGVEIRTAEITLADLLEALSMEGVIA